MDKSILAKAIVKNGILPQSMIAVEELSELQKEISKATRGFENKSALTEEIADVLIMIEQVKMIYNLSDKEIQQQIDHKINRLEKRLTAE